MRIHSSSLTPSAASLQRRLAAESSASRDVKINELQQVKKVTPQNQNPNNQSFSQNQQTPTSQSLVPARNPTFQPTDLRTIKALNSYSQETRRPLQSFGENEPAASIDTYA
ncbi:MAG: hypothetical protein CTY34_10395 [Methylobacter sp.]|nr:MAG: hypothetical protein CTY34_10395 [Methylobacter sp.]PPD03962.1 MAG: hypothetical protein CTY29_07510 [Methylobacter sp.]PPD17893.1 MAG: hypothetical protein CTY24_13995 [Methylobacter sp.]PPD36520.1 MAG: hypothetical protein CTY18_03860 [Methylomonas sp.]